MNEFEGNMLNKREWENKIVITQMCIEYNANK